MQGPAAPTRRTHLEGHRCTSGNLAEQVACSLGEARLAKRQAADESDSDHCAQCEVCEVHAARIEVNAERIRARTEKNWESWLEMRAAAG